MDKKVVGRDIDSSKLLKDNCKYEQKAEVGKHFAMVIVKLG